jgi:hypothetical protein
VTTPPDYDTIAASILSHGVTQAGLATALRAAYARGRDDGINQEEMDLLLRRRVSQHAAKVCDLADRVGRLTAEVKQVLPVEKP